MRTRIISILVVAFMMIASAMVLTSCNKDDEKTDSKTTVQPTNQQKPSETKQEKANLQVSGQQNSQKFIVFNNGLPGDGKNFVFVYDDIQKEPSGDACIVKGGSLGEGYCVLASKVDAVNERGYDVNYGGLSNNWADNWKTPTKCELKGDYYFYPDKLVFDNDGNCLFCFHLGNNTKMWIPHEWTKRLKYPYSTDVK